MKDPAPVEDRPREWRVIVVTSVVVGLIFVLNGVWGDSWLSGLAWVSGGSGVVAGSLLFCLAARPEIACRHSHARTGFMNDPGQEYGDGAPRVLIHGWPLSGRSWERRYLRSSTRAIA